MLTHSPIIIILLTNTLSLSLSLQKASIVSRRTRAITFTFDRETREKVHDFVSHYRHSNKVDARYDARAATALAGGRMEKRGGGKNDVAGSSDKSSNKAAFVAQRNAAANFAVAIETRLRGLRVCA